MKIYWLLMGLFLTGCGFQPLYQQPSAESASTTLPFILEVRGNNDEAYGTYKFKQELKILLADVSSSNLRKITVSLNENFGDIGYGADASVLRSQGQMTATVCLYNVNHQVIYKNRLEVVSSYSTDNAEEFSNLSAKTATRERLIVCLAQDVARDIYRVLRDKS